MSQDLIGAWNLHPASPSARDVDGHGSHTGSTIAGNVHDATITVGTGEITRTVQAVAPRANVISYLVCFPTCPATSSVAAVDQAIEDGVTDIVAGDSHTCAVTGDTVAYCWGSDFTRSWVVGPVPAPVRPGTP